MTFDWFFLMGLFEEISVGFQISDLVQISCSSIYFLTFLWILYHFFIINISAISKIVKKQELTDRSESLISPLVRRFIRCPESENEAGEAERTRDVYIFRGPRENALCCSAPPLGSFHSPTFSSRVVQLTTSFSSFSQSFRPPICLPNHKGPAVFRDLNSFLALTLWTL